MIQDKNLPREHARSRMVFFAPNESGPAWEEIRDVIALQPDMSVKMPPHPLVRQLAWAVVVKLLLLTAIWWCFLADQEVEVDAEQASRHLLMHPTTETSKEQDHDF